MCSTSKPPLNPLCHFSPLHPPSCYMSPSHRLRRVAESWALHAQAVGPGGHFIIFPADQTAPSLRHQQVAEQSHANVPSSPHSPHPPIPHSLHPSTPHSHLPLPSPPALFRHSEPAVALATCAWQVTLLDGGVFGPSLPHLLALHIAGRPLLTGLDLETSSRPLLALFLNPCAHAAAACMLCMSVGFLVPADVADRVGVATCWWWTCLLAWGMCFRSAQLDAAGLTVRSPDCQFHPPLHFPSPGLQACPSPSLPRTLLPCPSRSPQGSPCFAVASPPLPCRARPSLLKSGSVQGTGLASPTVLEFSPFSVRLSPFSARPLPIIHVQTHASSSPFFPSPPFFSLAHSPSCHPLSLYVSSAYSPPLLPAFSLLPTLPPPPHPPPGLLPLAPSSYPRPSPPPLATFLSPAPFLLEAARKSSWSVALFGAPSDGRTSKVAGGEGCLGRGLLGERVAGGEGCWGRGLLGERVAGGEGCWGRGLLGARVAGGEGCWGRGLLGERVAGGEGCWGRGLLGERVAGGEGCWGRGLLGERVRSGSGGEQLPALHLPAVQIHASVAASLAEKKQKRVLFEGLMDRIKHMLPPADMDEVIGATAMVYTHAAVKLSDLSLTFTRQQDMSRSVKLPKEKITDSSTCCVRGCVPAYRMVQAGAETSQNIPALPIYDPHLLGVLQVFAPTVCQQVAWCSCLRHLEASPFVPLPYPLRTSPPPARCVRTACAAPCDRMPACADRMGLRKLARVAAATDEQWELQG
ncbi:unnamed protein product [Closterium sp. NIES-64]|nr:unnamed protein product [Closterium sp. NIES-64]